MEKILKDFCDISCTSSNEEEIKKYIINNITSNKKYLEDGLKNLIVTNKNTSNIENQIMITANLDESGLMVTNITEDGSLLFESIGNVRVESLIGSVVDLNDKIYGVIGVKPVHLQTEEEKNTFQKPKDLFIDIGCDSKEQAEEFIKIGDIFTFKSEFKQSLNDNFKARSLGDKFCCSVLLKLLNENLDCDFTGAFLVKEKAGLDSAKTASYCINPKVAIVLKPIFINEMKSYDFKDEIVVPIHDSRVKYDKDLIDLAEQTAKMSEMGFKKVILNTPIHTAKSIVESNNGIKTVPILFTCASFNQTQVAKKETMMIYFNFIKNLIKQL